MTGDEMFTFFQEMNDGRSMNETLFYQRLNLAKNKRERARDWVVLRTEDSSNQVSSSTTYETAFTMPSRFIRTVGMYPIKLVSSTGAVIPLRLIPFKDRHLYQNSVGTFAIDYKNSQFYIMGSFGQTYTIHFTFIQGTADIDDTGTWDNFPSDFHPLLPLDVSFIERGQVGYDDINRQAAAFTGKDIGDIEDAMVLWNARLQVNDAGV